MQRFILFVFSVLVFCGCQQDASSSSSANGTDFVPAGYDLVWQDEFNYEGLPDDDKWGYQTGGHGWGNRELQYYADRRKENARAEGGNLIITARQEPAGRNQYSSSRLVSKHKADFTYGYFEIRAQLPSGRGLWPAIWLLGDTVTTIGWPNAGEIDIVEHVGFAPDTIYATAHSVAANHINGTATTQAHYLPTAQTEFNTYSVLWEETQLVWSINGQAFHREERPASFDANNWPYQWPFYFIFNIAVGGNWGGQQGIDNDAFPAEMLIDYVRVYQKS